MLYLYEKLFFSANTAKKLYIVMIETVKLITSILTIPTTTATVEL